MTLKPHILVVDAEEVIPQLLQKTFASDYDISICGDALCAADLLLAEPFDLLIVDLEMPVLGGAELIRAIRRYSEFRELPIVALSGDTRAVTLKDRFLVQALISKPLSVAELAPTLRQLVSLYPSKR